MRIATGSGVGRYEILGPLGAGGMGEVYRARDPRLDRQVAIKLLPDAMAADADARERLRREALAVAALDHPFICKIFEIVEEDQHLFLVMEYIAGTTLHDRLLAGPLPLPEALRLAGEIAEALQEAHASGFLHRDLKPANIMLTQQGHVKVMDFGLAKRVEQVTSATDVTREVQTPQLTAHGAVVGTPDYMSPEQMKGMPLDARSDIFSFGVILAEMTGGKHPFRKQSTVETFSAILSQPPALSGDTPQGLSILLQRLLAKEAADRHPSIADVRSDLASLSTSGTIAALRPLRPSSVWKRLAAAAVIVPVAATAYLIVQSGARRPPSTPAATATTPSVIRSIAVLPLDNYSGDATQDYFAEGMTDELTAELATISQIRVISRGSVMQFKGRNRPPTPEIAKLLDVDAIVEGSVRRSGDRVRITAQLIDARADKHLWARTFERNSRDVLALQGELASAIAGEINVQLTPTEKSRLASAHSVNPDAYDAYLKGRYFFNRPSDENLKKAIGQFEETVRLSPDFAPAYSGLSDAYLWAGYNEGFLTGSEARPKAKSTAEKAVQLDDNSAEAHTSLAVFKLFYEYDWEGCEREFRRAIALNPNYAFAHDQFGLGLAFQGRLEEAVAEGRRALALDPLSPQIRVDHALALMFQGNYRAAKEQARKAAELDPTYYFPLMLDGWIDLQERKFSDAIPLLQQAKALDSPAFVTAWLAYAYAASGDRTRAMEEMNDLKKRSLRGEVLPFNLAIVHLGLGDRQRAIDYLEQAHASDSQWMGWLKNDRMFDSLRSEPRFAALLKKLRLAS